MSIPAPLLNPEAIASMCGDKQRHDTRAAAHVEATEKNRLSGRRHKVLGCGICLGHHVYVSNPAAAAKRANKKGNRRRGWAPAPMGA